MFDHHRTDATSISATVFSAAISAIDDESSVERCPSAQLFSVDSGKIVAEVRGLSVSMSTFEPFLCVLLCLRSCLNFSEMNVVMGRREGRHANDDRNSLDVS